MKKLIGIAAAGAMLVALAGCASGGDAAAEGPKPLDELVVGFAQVGAESGWRTANTKDIQAAFEEAGIELKFSDAQQKQENQIKAIRSYIQQGVDYIAFSPVVETGWELGLLPSALRRRLEDHCHGEESAQTRRIFTVGTKNPIGPKRSPCRYGGRAAALTEENHLAADVPRRLGCHRISRLPRRAGHLNNAPICRHDRSRRYPV